MHLSTSNFSPFPDLFPWHFSKRPFPLSMAEWFRNKLKNIFFIFCSWGKHAQTFFAAENLWPPNHFFHHIPRSSRPHHLPRLGKRTRVMKSAAAAATKYQPTEWNDSNKCPKEIFRFASPTTTTPWCLTAPNPPAMLRILGGKTQRFPYMQEFQISVFFSRCLMVGIRTRSHLLLLPSPSKLRKTLQGPRAEFTKKSRPKKVRT